MRRCGPCQECCTIMAIEVLDKPENTRCVNQCSKGCGIYKDRPQECREFECLWRFGSLPKYLKPSRTHCVVWTATTNTPEGPVPTYRFNFSNKHPRHAAMVNLAMRMSAKHLVIVRHADQYRAIINGRQTAPWTAQDSVDIDMRGGRVIDVRKVDEVEGLQG